MRGYRAVITTSPKCSQEKIASIKAYGAEIIVSPPGERFGEVGSLVSQFETFTKPLLL